MKSYFWILAILLISCQEKLVTHSLDRSHKDKVKSYLTIDEFKSKFSCDPSLVSQWVQEKSTIKAISVKYGKLELTRSDIGEPDGFLDVKYDVSCRIELSLMPEIYFSEKDKLLVIWGYDGSGSSAEVFDLNQKCELVGVLPDGDHRQIFETWKSGTSNCQN
jgi:hypothetical protein